MKKNVALIFIPGVLWYFLAGRRYEQPEQGQDCLGSAWLCSVFLLSACQVGRRYQVSGVCQACQCSQPCPVPETESPDCVILISCLACDEEQCVALEPWAVCVYQLRRFWYPCSAPCCFPCFPWIPWLSWDSSVAAG